MRETEGIRIERPAEGSAVVVFEGEHDVTNRLTSCYHSSRRIDSSSSTCRKPRSSTRASSISCWACRKRRRLKIMSYACRWLRRR
jgi:hypothetical protein